MTVFNTVANSLNYYIETILNFCKNRQTNANAESFNSKIKLLNKLKRWGICGILSLYNEHAFCLIPIKLMWPTEKF